MIQHEHSLSKESYREAKRNGRNTKPSRANIKFCRFIGTTKDNMENAKAHLVLPK